MTSMNGIQVVLRSPKRVVPLNPLKSEVDHVRLFKLSSLWVFMYKPTPLNLSRRIFKDSNPGLSNAKHQTALYAHGFQGLLSKTFNLRPPKCLPFAQAIVRLLSTPMPRDLIDIESGLVGPEEHIADATVVFWQASSLFVLVDWVLATSNALVLSDLGLSEAGAGVVDNADVTDHVVVGVRSGRNWSVRVSMRIGARGSGRGERDVLMKRTK
jgi:hypothetical protein